MNRQNQILSILLAIQIVLGVIIFWPRSTVSGAEAGPLLGDFKADQVVVLTVSDSDGNRVTLAKNAEGWVLPEADDYPADGQKIAELLQKIEKVRANRLVTRTEASHQRLKVSPDNFERLIELRLADGKTQKLYVGSSPRSSATHVRADDRPETYLTGDLASYEVNASVSRWINTLYYTVPETSTIALTLQNQNGLFQFERNAEEQWTMLELTGDEVFNRSAFNTWLGQAVSVRMVEPVGRQEEEQFGLDQPQAVLTLKSQDGHTYTLAIGAKDEDNNYIAKWSDSPYYVRVAEFTAANFVNKTRADFIQPPSTPTPEAGAQPTEGAPDSGG